MSKKNHAAQALAKKRWAGTTAAERSEQMSAVAGSIGKRAARARARKAWETKRRKEAAKQAKS